jgi:hypothetical protein
VSGHAAATDEAWRQLAERLASERKQGLTAWRIGEADLSAFHAGANTRSPAVSLLSAAKSHSRAQRFRGSAPHKHAIERVLAA